MDNSLLSNNPSFYRNDFRMTTNRREFITNTAKLPIEIVKRLIAAVAKRPDLWDRNYDRFGKKRSQALWRDISAEVNLPVDICRIKWGHLRDNFRKVFIRNTLTDETPTRWRFYNDMRFLEKTISRNIAFKNRLKEQQAEKRAQIALQTPQTPRRNDETTQEFDQTENSMRFNSVQNFEENSPTNLEHNSINHEPYIDSSPRIKIEPQDERELETYNFYERNNSNAIPSVPSVTNAAPSTLNQNGQDNDYINTTDDNTPLEECYADHLSYHQALTAKRKGQIYTIEMFDDEQPVELLPVHRQHTNKINDYTKRVEGSKSSYPTSSNYTMDRCDEEDTDRLFLLSLLPYLQSIPLQRKLQVRQKLQSVLIEENA